MSKNQERRNKNVRLADKKPSLKLLSEYKHKKWSSTCGHVVYTLDLVEAYTQAPATI